MATVTVTSPEGVDYEINAPDDATDDQIMQYAEDQFASGQLGQSTEPVETPKIEDTKDFAPMPSRKGLEPEYSSNPELEDSLQKRKFEVQQSREEYQKGNVGFTEKEAQILAKGGGGAALDFLGHEMSQAFGGLFKAATPENQRENVKNMAAVTWAMTTHPKAIAKLKEYAGEVGDWWSELDKNTRKNLESLGILGAWVSPAKVRAGAKPIIDATKKSAITKAAIKPIERSVTKLREKYAREFVAPKLTEKVAEEQIKRHTVAGGFVKPDIVKLSPTEEKMASAVSKVKGVSRNNHLMKNIERVNQHIDDNVASIKNLAKTKGKVITDNTDALLADATTRVMQDNAQFIGDSGKQGMTRLFAARQIVKNAKKKGKLTSEGMLRARKDFDDLIKAQDGKKAFDPETPLGQLNLSIRKEMNDIFDRSVGGKASANFEQTSLLIKANENATKRQVGMSAHAIVRQFQNIGQVLKFKQYAVAGALLTGTGVLAGMQYVAPLLAGTLSLAGIYHVGRRVVLSTSARSGLIKLLSATDKAIKASTNAAMRAELNTGKAAIVGLLNNASKEDENDK